MLLPRVLIRILGRSEILTYRETLETAMLTVNRSENAASVRFSRVVSLVSENWPRDISIRQPKDAEPVWRVVRSHGKLN